MSAPEISATQDAWRSDFANAPTQGHEWTAETPFDFVEGVATAFSDETAEPLFLVFWQRCPLGSETTHWCPLPPPPAGAKR